MCDRTRRILVIDDDVETLDFLRLFLAAEGFAVRTAHSLAAAEAELTATRPDIVICDARLPGLPVFAVLDWLRANPRMRDLPILVCTGAVNEVEAAGERLQQGRTLVLLKPFDINDLLAQLDRLCPPQDAHAPASDDTGHESGR